MSNDPDTDPEKVHLTVKPSPDDSRDHVADTVYAQAGTVDLPKELDLRPFLPACRSQGTQGACGAFSAVAMLQYHDIREDGLDEYLSPQFIYLNRTNYPKGGMHGRDIMKILKKHGACLEKSFPYIAGGRKPLSAKAAATKKRSALTDEMKKEAKVFRIDSYATVKSVWALRKALYQDGPCVISFPVYSKSKPDMWNPDYPGQKRKGGHAMCVVGYTKVDGRKCFIIRNSWGKQWGDKGHCYYPYDEWGAHWEVWTTTNRMSRRVDGARYDNWKAKQARKMHEA